MLNLDELTPGEIAVILFRDFDVMQSMTIKGFVTDENRRIERKGQLVLDELEAMDSKAFNCTKKSDGRPRRKRVKPPNTIGGYVAQKIWKYKHDIIDQIPRTIIWRIQ